MSTSVQIPVTATLPSQPVRSPSLSGPSGGGGLIDPVPMSMPAILRNPTLKHLHGVSQPRGPRIDVGQSGRGAGGSRDVEGRRRRLRKENDSFAGNPHIAAPTARDRQPALASLPRTTFPTPLPPQLLPRIQPAPSPAPKMHDPASADAGRFTMSLRGVRKVLAPRGRGSQRARDVVSLVEREVREWLEGGIILNPDVQPASARRVIDATSVSAAIGDGSASGDEPAITEIARTHASLTWSVPERFERFCVHCVARWWGVVSFSKTSPTGERLTYLVRPHAPVRAAQRAGLDTPPTTDADPATSSAFETESEAGGGGGFAMTDASEWETSSEADGPLPTAAFTPRTFCAPALSSDDGESAHGDDEPDPEPELDERLGTLALDRDRDATPRTGRSMRITPRAGAGSSSDSSRSRSRSRTRATPRGRGRGRPSAGTGGVEIVRGGAAPGRTRTAAGAWKEPETSLWDYLFVLRRED